jgi:endonuclease YncB( thermonuclease family)
VLLDEEPQDDYGRDLVYLWLPNGRLFNAMLARRGLA